MPGRDATGPLGGGPGTGRGLGGCVSGVAGRGVGFGRGRGFGRCFGFIDPGVVGNQESDMSRRIALLEEKIDRLIEEKGED
ncbi:hypothetical protein Dpep_0418 [Dethiosulfovibrio peptidovorans DSM 11002]|uniref:Cytoplasmic protein n=1 Tax=Dethiosulfovibrio peptidovorans DSM 11002 TaxID=469381 RepID=D2Z4C1_9BACT|nr:DUF5320 family protein [Dethiosulfovibrio peptidovorans]EFC90450.1 hypothetical protein Dpep_0418 [Dethiosulfovibrio peptidovorans DSM 11002]